MSSAPEHLSFLFYLLGAVMPALWVHQDLEMFFKIYLQTEALHSMGLPGFVSMEVSMPQFSHL
jgi:hypothetical protein